MGAGALAPVAYRWRTQINENAKIPAFAHELPELDHNELVGWGGASELGRFAAVFLDDADTHPRVKRRIELTRTEYQLLELFVRNPRAVLTRSAIFEHVWGYDFDPGSNVVDVYVRYLRAKFGADRIETVRGMGYRLR